MEEANNLFTFLSVGSALNRTFNIYMSRWQLYTQLALIAVIPRIILSIVLEKTRPFVDGESAGIAAMETAMGNTFGFPTVPIQQITPVPFTFLFGIIIQAAVVHIVSEYYTQKDSTFRGSLVHAIDRFWSVFGFGLLYWAALCLYIMVAGVLMDFLSAVQTPDFLSVLAGFAAFLFPVFVIFSLTLVLPVLVIEKQSPIGAIKRSFELLPTYRCYVSCSMFLLALVVIFVFVVYHNAVQAIFGTSILGSAISGLSGVVAFPLQTM